MVAVAPRCEARVSPELVRILAGLDLPRENEAPALPELGGAEGLPRKDISRVSHGPAQTWLLRRDGLRPVRLEGALLCDLSETRVLTGGNHGIRTQIRLFAATDGTVYAQGICTPDDGMPALAIHRARDITTIDDLSRLILEISPKACLAVAPPGSHLPLAQSTGDEPAFAGIRQSDLSLK